MGKYSGFQYDNGLNTIAPAVLYRLGRNPADKKAALRPNPKVNVFELEQYGNFDVSLQDGSKFLDTLPATYMAVNGLPFYWMLGNSANTIADQTTTISLMNGQNLKPRLAFWEHTDTQKMAYFNCALDNLKYELTNAGLQINHNAIGCTWGENGVSPSLEFPKDVTPNEVDSGYSHISSMTWDTQAITPLRNSLSGEFKQSITGIPASDGIFYEALSEFGTMHHILNVQFSSTEVEAYLMEHFLAQQSKELIFQIDKTENNHYLEFTQNARLVSLIPARDFERGIDIYQAMFVTQIPSIESQDYLDQSVYYI